MSKQRWILGWALLIVAGYLTFFTDLHLLAFVASVASIVVGWPMIKKFFSY